MNSTALVPLLFTLTILAVIVFALVSKRRTERRLNEDKAPKSTLAKDAPNAR